MTKRISTKQIVLAALFAALTAVTTLVPHIPTPTFGYIHIGDGLVLLSGFLLGPFLGSIAAGIGSCLADLFTGYFIYAPATLIIKALTAFFGGQLFLLLRHLSEKRTDDSRYLPALLPAGIVAELFMTFGYFVFEIFYMAAMAGGFTKTTIAAGFASSLSGVPYNLVQGIFGVILAAVLYPLVNPLVKRMSKEV